MLLCVAFQGHAALISGDILFGNINLWSSGPTFEMAANVSDFHFTGWWNDDKPTAFDLEWQELTYDRDHGELEDRHQGRIHHEGDERGEWTDRQDCDRPLAPPESIPEPGTLLLLGSGLLGLAITGARKKFRK